MRDAISRRSRAIRALALLEAVAALSGCGIFTDAVSVDELVVVPVEHRKGGEDAFVREFNEVFKVSKYRPVDLKTFKGPNSDSWLAKIDTKADRKALQFWLLRVSDQICERHMAGIFGIRLLKDVSVNAAITGVGTAGALLTGGVTRVLAGVAAGLAALNSYTNETVYQNYLALTVLRQIEKDRVDYYRIKIEPKINAELSQYSAAEAVFDAQRYHLKCSFHSGLNSLLINSTPRDGAISVADLIEQESGRLRASIDRHAILAAKRKEIAGNADLSNSERQSQLAVIDREMRDERALQDAIRQKLATYRRLELAAPAAPPPPPPRANTPPPNK